MATDEKIPPSSLAGQLRLLPSIAFCSGSVGVMVGAIVTGTFLPFVGLQNWKNVVMGVAVVGCVGSLVGSAFLLRALRKP